MHATPALEYATFCSSARATSTCMMRASRPACWLPAGSAGSSSLYSDSWLGCGSGLGLGFGFGFGSKLELGFGLGLGFGFGFGFGFGSGVAP